MFSSTFVVLALSASALANVFVTAPVSSTTFAAGKPNTVSWQDNGQQPTLQAFGPAIVSIYAGNSQQQTLLQTISPNVDVSKTQSVIFTPDPAIGPNANQYFIRFESIGLKDAAQPQYPALAFSAKFTMSGMTGTFNASVQAQINGQSTAPIGGTVAPSSSTSASTPHNTVMTTTKTSSSVSAAGGAATGVTKTGGANKLAGAGIGAFAAVGIAVLNGVFC